MLAGIGGHSSKGKQMKASLSRRSMLGGMAAAVSGLFGCLLPRPASAAPAVADPANLSGQPVTLYDSGTSDLRGGTQESWSSVTTYNRDGERVEHVDYDQHGRVIRHIRYS